jgi:hypothetical protein
MSVFSGSEKHHLVVPVEEEEIPECHHLPRIPPAGFAQGTGLSTVSIKDEVREDTLLLLPEILGVSPRELYGIPLFGCRCIASKHLPGRVEADLGHSRLLRLLLAHGLIRKVPHSQRYLVTARGEALMGPAVYIRH